MPSDLAKKKAAKKKEAAKGRGRTKKSDELDGEGDQPGAQTNGASNGERPDLNKHFFCYLYSPLKLRSTLADVESKPESMCFCFDRCRGYN